MLQEKLHYNLPESLLALTLGCFTLCWSGLLIHSCEMLALLCHFLQNKWELVKKTKKRKGEGLL